MFKLDATMEALNDSTLIEEVEVEVSMEELEALELEINEESVALESLEMEINECNSVIASTEDVIARLEALDASIEEYGICAPTMLAVDCTENLREALGLPAYTELSVAPVKDENATNAGKGIKETLKNIWTRIVAFMSALAAKVKNFFAAIFTNTDKLKKALVAVGGMVAAAGVKAEDFKKKEVNGYKDADLMAFVHSAKAVTGPVKDKMSAVLGEADRILSSNDLFSAANEEKLASGMKDLFSALEAAKATANFGFKTTVKGEGKSVSDYSFEVVGSGLSTSKVTLGEMFGDAGKTKSTCAAMASVLNDVDGAKKVAKGLEKTIADQQKQLKKAISELDKNDVAALKSNRDIIRVCKAIIAFVSRFIMTLLSVCSQKAKVVLSCAKAGTKAPKAKKEAKA